MLKRGGSNSRFASGHLQAQPRPRVWSLHEQIVGERPGVEMAVREFTDVDGVRWRAWEIKPEEIHPVTRGEDYLADCFVVGWIVFETMSGSDKRRLCPYPASWAKASHAQLRQLLARAERIPPRKLDAERQAVGGDSQGTPSLVEVPESQDKLDVTDLQVVRSFRYPGGRLWTVCVVQHPDDGGEAALRFNAGARNIDLRPWPKDWADAPDELLVELLRLAAPRMKTDRQPADARRRRGNDHARG